MTMMSEMTIGEMPMDTSFVGASAARARLPPRSRKGCRGVEVFFERDASGIAGANWEGETGGILLQSEIQRINRRSSNPPIRTATGNPKMDVAENAGPPAAGIAVRFSCGSYSIPNESK